MKRLILAVFVCLMALGAPALAYNPLQPCSPDAVAAGTCTNPCPAGSTAAACQDSAAQIASNKNPVVNTIAKAAKIISLLVGVASVVLILVSGISLIMSSGNPEAVKGAKSRVVAAVVGLAVAGLAWLIVSLVTNRLL